jgi:NAD(P)-dependent dehydrogenase (short-subunit alcohol dehydrogenase family)
MDINLKGAYFSCLEATRQLIKQGRGGVIINVASQSSFRPDINLSVYNIAKAGMIMLTKNLAIDLAQYNIRVNAICPGATLTPGQKDNIKWLEQDFLPRIPLGRLAHPDDIANTALFLASPISSYITGTHILCDGGCALT